MQCSAHHMSFPVADVEVSKQFYGGFLGLKEIPRPEIFKSFLGAWYEAGGAEVHLIEVATDADVGSPPASINPMGRHSAFAVDSYAEALAEVNHAGYEVLETNQELGQLWIKDPDGHVIELIAPGPLLATS